MIITIDGPAGAGKSTIARHLAQRLGILYVDTGAMYRALTLKALRRHLPPDDTTAILAMARDTEVRLESGVDGKVKVLLDKEDVTGFIRTPELTNAVFHVAQIPQIRRLMVQWQREYGIAHDIVMEGRDIGTVVFPDADFKFFLDADVSERARRRLLDLKDQGIECSLAELKKEIENRDQRDRERTCGPLRRADDAYYVDSTRLSIDEVIERLLTVISDAKK